MNTSQNNTKTNTTMNTPDLNSLREQVKDIDKKSPEKEFVPIGITLSKEGAVILPLIIVGLVAYIFRLKKKCVEGKD
jgi:hypothetical protein